MENLGTYFFTALAIAFVIYNFTKKKTSATKAKGHTKPSSKSASKSNPKNPKPKKVEPGQKKKGKAPEASPILGTDLEPTQRNKSGKTSIQAEFEPMAELSLDSVTKANSKSLETSKTLSTPVESPRFDLEHEVKQLMGRTGWDYSTAKSYCQLSLDYHKKVLAGATLKK